MHARCECGRARSFAPEPFIDVRWVSAYVMNFRDTDTTENDCAKKNWNVHCDRTQTTRLEERGLTVPLAASSKCRRWPDIHHVRIIAAGSGNDPLGSRIREIYLRKSKHSLAVESTHHPSARNLRQIVTVGTVLNRPFQRHRALPHVFGCCTGSAFDLFVQNSVFHQDVFRQVIPSASTRGRGTHRIVAPVRESPSVTFATSMAVRRSCPLDSGHRWSMGASATRASDRLDDVNTSCLRASLTLFFLLWLHPFCADCCVVKSVAEIGTSSLPLAAGLRV